MQIRFFFFFENLQPGRSMMSDLTIFSESQVLDYRRESLPRFVEPRTTFSFLWKLILLPEQTNQPIVLINSKEMKIINFFFHFWQLRSK